MLELPPEPCQYESHRPSYWRLVDSDLVQCGICHPPAPRRDRPAVLVSEHGVKPEPLVD